MDGLEHELKVKIIETLDLGDELTPEQIGDTDRLVGGDHGIDSIDVLEMVILLENDYGVLIDSKELGEQVFASVKAMADYIRAQRAAKAS